MQGKLEPRSIAESYADLAGAICAEAVKEYRTAYKMYLDGHLGQASHCRTLEKFFRGEWFDFLMNGAVSGEMVIQEVRRQCLTSKNICAPTSRR